MPALDLATILTSLILLTVALVVLFLYMQRARAKMLVAQDSVRVLQEQLEANFFLSGYLLEAQDETAAILAAMRAGNDFLRADGCSFVPFNEWQQTLPVLKLGDAPFLQNADWQTRLSTPSTRHACRNCESKQAGAECILLQSPADAENVFCIALRSSGREIGVVSYYFSAPPTVTERQQAFLQEMVRLTDLTLDAMRTHAQELEAIRAAQRPSISENSLSFENQGLLEQLKYQAVLDERNRLAREIHDGLAQTLAFLKMEAARMQTYSAKGDIASLEATLQACHRTLSDAYLDARQAIDNLRRVPDESLSEWISQAASDFESLTDLPVDVANVSLVCVFPNSIKAQLIRIVQEALTNIRKHAQAKAVSIAAFERKGEAILEIKDDGRGFTPDDVNAISQYGLRGMRERAESIQADFQVISAPAMGTTIRLQIPIREKANL